MKCYLINTPLAFKAGKHMGQGLYYAKKVLVQHFLEYGLHIVQEEIFIAILLPMPAFFFFEMSREWSKTATNFLFIMKSE